MPFLTITSNQGQSDHYKRAGRADMKSWNSASLGKQSHYRKEMLFFDCLVVGDVSKDSLFYILCALCPSPWIQFSAYICSTSPRGSGLALTWTY